MDDWTDNIHELESKMDALHTINPIICDKLNIHMIKKYVDDISTDLEVLKRGTR